MTDKQKSEVRATAAALETLDMGGVADLVRRQYAELETLRTGYAAARLEIESLKAQLAEPVSAPESAYQRGYLDGIAKGRSDAEAAPQQGASPTAGMNIAQRILHVGGRNNAAGYVEFGSIQAVEALVRQVLRDLPAAPQQEAQEPVAVVVPCYTPSGKRVALYSAKQDLPIGTQLYTAHQPSPAAQVDALDAERYAIVRRGQHWSVIDGLGDPLTGDRLDAAVDAVSAAQEDK